MPKYTFIIPIRLPIVKQTGQIAPCQPPKSMELTLHLPLPPLYCIPGVPFRLFRKKARATFTPQIPPIQPRQKLIKRVDTFNRNNPGNSRAAKSAAVKVNNTPTQPPFAQPLSFIIHPAVYPPKKGAAILTRDTSKEISLVKFELITVMATPVPKAPNQIPRLNNVPQKSALSILLLPPRLLRLSYIKIRYLTIT
jgi:hypothetical protein